MAQILQVAALALATVGGGAATMSVMKPDMPDFAVPEGDWEAGSDLDGLSFDIVAQDLDSHTITSDALVFRAGTFQSVNCEQYCNFGWSEYQTKRIDGVIHFTATTQCPDAPHRVVWYGQVRDGDIEVSGTWTTRRWYWTHQIRFEGQGQSVPAGASEVSG